MPRLTLVYPAIGRAPDRGYVRSWQMQPLAMAALAGLTPPEWNITFFDDRLEPVDDTLPTDLAAISIETFTARRGYQLAARFRRRGVPVILGGYHATACPKEALMHADSVCVGEAEPVWAGVLADVVGGRLKPLYQSPPAPSLAGLRPNRSIFQGKPYFRLALVESGRGCPFRCEFCSVSAFYGARHRRRPIPEIVAELRSLNARFVFFVDDNMLGDFDRARELFTALKSLDLRWVSQAGLPSLNDESLLRDMAASGCVGLLVGFESLASSNLRIMGKSSNRAEDYRSALARLRRAGISVYGTFLFGYPHDSSELYEETVRFSQSEQLYLAAFNHVIPFPGTPLHARLSAAGRLPAPAWWLREDYRFGQVPFSPESMSAKEIENRCHNARRKFYAMPSIIRRAADFRANCRGLRKSGAFFTLNLLLRREINQKRGYPLGDPDEPPPSPASG
ncbi:MAG: radical SAM protein [Planctomycetota bacterium]